MKTKQILGIIIAGIVFVFVCTCSMAANLLMDKFASVFDDLDDGPTSKYIGVIKIEGELQKTSSSSVLTEGDYDHDFVLDSIDECMDSDDNKGIMLYMNTPGGTVTAADEVYLKLMEYKEKTERPVWAYVDEMCCSGGYYIAMAADNVISARTADVGSIGVYIQTYDASGLLDKIGVKTDYIKSSDNKAMGAVSEPLTPEQKAIFQSQVDEYYNQFLEIVKSGRSKLSADSIKKLADGRTYTAKQAKGNGLVDDIMTYEKAKDAMNDSIEKKYDFYTYEKETNFWDDFYMKAASLKKKSDSEVVLNYVEEQKSGEAMYYAMP